MDKNKTLPPWFKKPDPEMHCQLYLFAPKLNEVAVEYKVSIDELNRWHEKGWLSFNPKENREFSEPDIFEIRFIRDIVRSGLSDACLEKLFIQLSKPYSYNPDRIAYSFSLGWVEHTESCEEIDYAEVIEEHLEEWLYEISANGDEEAINNIISMIEKIKDQVND